MERMVEKQKINLYLQKKLLLLLAMKKNLFLSLFLTFGMLKAGVIIPQPSTHQKIEQDFSISKIGLDYYRPNVKNREIYGNIVPYGQIWRTGANTGTKISFEQAVKINGIDLAKGEYFLYTIPQENETWELLFSQKNNLWESPNIHPETIVLKTTVKAKKANTSTETLIFSFENVKENELDLKMNWSDIELFFTISAENDLIVFDQIDQGMQSTEKPYYQAANYYFQNWNSTDSARKNRAQQKKITELLSWVTEAAKIDGAEGNAFWINMLEANIAIAANKKDQAKTAFALAKNKASKTGYLSIVAKIEEAEKNINTKAKK